MTLLAKNGIRVQSTFNSNGATVSLRPGVAVAGSGATGGYTDVRYYYLSDHLGSVRVTLTETGAIDSWSDYYPFGKEARGSSTVNEPKEQFTGKERDYESGLDYFGARYYNSEIGRFSSADPLSQYPSPYVYVGNNPLVMIDPTGQSAEDYNGFNSANAQRDFDEADGGGKTHSNSNSNNGNTSSDDGGGEDNSNSADPPKLLKPSIDFNIGLGAYLVQKQMIGKRRATPLNLKINGAGPSIKSIGLVSKWGGRISNLAGAAVLVQEATDPSVSKGKYAFHIATYGIGFFASSRGGAVVGAGVGFASFYLEFNYELVKWYNDQCAIISQRTESAMKNGWFFGRKP